MQIASQTPPLLLRRGDEPLVGCREVAAERPRTKRGCDWACDAREQRVPLGVHRSVALGLGRDEHTHGLAGVHERDTHSPSVVGLPGLGNHAVAVNDGHVLQPKRPLQGLHGSRQHVVRGGCPLQLVAKREQGRHGIVAQAEDEAVRGSLQSVAQRNRDQDRDDDGDRCGRARGADPREKERHHAIDGEDASAQRAVDETAAHDKPGIEQAIAPDRQPAGDADGDHAQRLERQGVEGRRAGQRDGRAHPPRGRQQPHRWSHQPGCCASGGFTGSALLGLESDRPGEGHRCDEEDGEHQAVGEVADTAGDTGRVESVGPVQQMRVEQGGHEQERADADVDADRDAPPLRREPPVGEEQRDEERDAELRRHPRPAVQPPGEAGERDVLALVESQARIEVGRGSHGHEGPANEQQPPDDVPRRRAHSARTNDRERNHRDRLDSDEDRVRSVLPPRGDDQRDDRAPGREGDAHAAQDDGPAVHGHGFFPSHPLVVRQ